MFSLIEEINALKEGVWVQKIFVKITNDDLVAGILLSQIVSWYSPSKSGGTKLRVQRDGKFWLVKKRTDWFNECYISDKQYDRAIKILKKLDLLECRLIKFNGVPNVGIFLHKDVLLSNVNSYIQENEFYLNSKVHSTQTVNSILPKEQNPITEHTSSSSTETTSFKHHGKTEERRGAEFANDDDANVNVKPPNPTLPPNNYDVYLPEDPSYYNWDKIMNILKKLGFRSPTDFMNQFQISNIRYGIHALRVERQKRRIKNQGAWLRKTVEAIVQEEYNPETMCDEVQNSPTIYTIDPTGGAF
ncbi:MAG: hypothetical protein WC614_13495 [bacterium]